MKPRPAAVIEKKSCPVSEEDETAFAPSLLNAIPSALLPDPNPEVTPVERALIIPSPIPETSGLMASGTGAKKPGKDIPDLRTLVQKVDVLKTAERVVDGVNYLTESRIQLYSVVNDQGKLTELVIHSEAFRLESRRNN